MLIEFFSLTVSSMFINFQDNVRCVAVMEESDKPQFSTKIVLCCIQKRNKLNHKIYDDGVKNEEYNDAWEFFASRYIHALSTLLL